MLNVGVNVVGPERGGADDEDADEDEEDDDTDARAVGSDTVPLANPLLLNNMSRISDSIGVLPTRRAKNISLIT